MARNQSKINKPVIGVTLSNHSSWFIWLAHKFAITRAGGKAKKITAKSGPYYEADGYVIGGGDDIGLEIEDGAVQPAVQYDKERDLLEQYTLAHAYGRSKPVLGICRGAQMINISRGGTLYSDLSDYLPHLRRQKLMLPWKDIKIEKRSMLFRLLKESKLSVNALHHQSVQKLGEDLRVVATDEDGVVQAIECSDRGLLLGVQWHPELIPWSRGNRSLFDWIVRKADLRVSSEFAN